MALSPWVASDTTFIFDRPCRRLPRGIGILTVGMRALMTDAAWWFHHSATPTRRSTIRSGITLKLPTSIACPVSMRCRILYPK